MGTRETLLAASAEEFAAYGLAGARIQAIVARAGINERMIYQHFGSKQGLYEAVLESQSAAVAAAWQPALVEGVALGPAAGLAHAFTALAEVFRERPLFMRLVLHEAMTGWEHAPKATVEDIPRELRALHRRGVREGVFRDDVAFEDLYLAVLGALNATSILAGRFADLRERRDPALPIVGLVLDGLAASKERSRCRAGS